MKLPHIATKRKVEIALKIYPIHVYHPVMYISLGSFIVLQSSPRTYPRYFFFLMYDQISDMNPHIFMFYGPNDLFY